MDSEPSIVCGVPGGPNARMRAVAILTIIMYAQQEGAAWGGSHRVQSCRSHMTRLPLQVRPVTTRVVLYACVRYVLGLPAAFSLFLWRKRVEVRSDQLLRERGEGDSALTNAHVQVRHPLFLWTQFGACVTVVTSREKWLAPFGRHSSPVREPVSVWCARCCSVTAVAGSADPPAIPQDIRGLQTRLCVLEGGSTAEEAIVGCNCRHGEQRRRAPVGSPPF